MGMAPSGGGSYLEHVLILAGFPQEGDVTQMFRQLKHFYVPWKPVLSN